jgi:hypothetical protein
VRTHCRSLRLRAQTLEPLWNLLIRCERPENCKAKISFCNFNALIGGRTRTRTLDPLIKSQLLYQLSYAPQPRGQATTMNAAQAGRRRRLLRVTAWLEVRPGPSREPYLGHCVGDSKRGKSLKIRACATRET